MRLGQNPAKSIKKGVAQPADIAVVAITYVPFLSGFYENSLDVLKFCLNSIKSNTTKPYDLIIFDNKSCEEVREYLLSEQEQNNIQRLILSEENIGKVNAWNFALRATTAKYVVYTDSDVYFHPGWLEEHLKIMDTYPNVGMLSGRPKRYQRELTSATMDWAENNNAVSIKRGKLQKWEDYLFGALNLGWTEEEANIYYKEGEDVLLTYKNVPAYLGAGHMQFMAPRSLLDETLPLKSTRHLGDDRQFDIKMNESGALKLCLLDFYVEHMGNNVPERLIINDQDTICQPEKEKHSEGVLGRIIEIPIVKRVLLKIYNVIFKLYYDVKR